MQYYKMEEIESPPETPDIKEKKLQLDDKDIPNLGSQQVAVQDPLTFSIRKKVLITTLVAFQTFIVSFASAIYTGGIRQIEKRFLVKDDVALLGLSLYVLGLGIGPLVWAPASELWGRKKPFVISYFIFAVAQLGPILAANYPTICITRLLAGMAGSSPLTNGGAILSDMWAPEVRVMPAFSFMLMVFLGPVSSPIVGGYIALATDDYKPVFYLVMGMAGATLFASLFLMPETHYATLIQKAGGTPKQMDVTATFFAAINRPCTMFFVEPIVTIMAAWLSVVYGTLYLLFAAFPVVYQLERRWDEGKGSLPFLGFGLGMILVFPMVIKNGKDYARAQAELPMGVKDVPPESRLRGAKIGGIILPVALIGFAWTCQPSIHWAVSVVFSLFVGMGMLLVFLSNITYLLDAYPCYPASALATNAILRSLVATAFPEFSPKLFAAMSASWAMTIIALISFVFVPVPFVFARYGPRLREKSSMGGPNPSR